MEPDLRGGERRPAPRDHLADHPTWRFVDSTDWGIVLESAATGTRIVQTFEVTRCPEWWERLVSRLVTAHLDRTSALTDDLVRIGAVAGQRQTRGERSRNRPTTPR